ncbi:GNAT family N-acetyltransferase [Jeotgalibacillus terrae]|uniref:GNAT family N-acetyltransferase n=1 Tax=Jeotgalibacillus terrae TaxID=587735 RepID=A0ABW5ZK54_9BACL|nr:ribosomal protein S18 acetylase RimI-like enzyme [Jeotgalibacillus terrae]
MNIIQATAKDSAAIASLFNAYRQFYKQAPDLEGAEQYIFERLSKEESVIFFVRESDQLLGFTQLYPVFSSISMKRAWVLNDLFVNETARKRGVGELLLQRVKAFAEETDAASVSLSTAPDNVNAQRLYERNGYKQDETFLHYELSI